MNRHEIPTHLNVEDKAFAGLTMRQLMTAAVGLGMAYGTASELPLPIPVRLAVAGVVLVGVAVIAVWRPAGRPMEDWAFILLRYWAVPRVAVWRPREVIPDVDQRTTSYEVVVAEPIDPPGSMDGREEANGGEWQEGARRRTGSPAPRRLR